MTKVKTELEQAIEDGIPIEHQAVPYVPTPFSCKIGFHKMAHFRNYVIVGAPFTGIKICLKCGLIESDNFGAADGLGIFTCKHGYVNPNKKQWEYTGIIDTYNFSVEEK